MTWGKVDPETLPDSVTCYTDSTIALPLLTAYARARHAPRPLRRLYDQLPNLYDTIRLEYEERLRQTDKQPGVRAPPDPGPRQRSRACARASKSFDLITLPRRSTICATLAGHTCSGRRPGPSRPGRARRWCPGLEEQWVGRVRDRDGLWPGGARYRARGRRPDLRGQRPACVEPADRSRARHRSGARVRGTGPSPPSAWPLSSGPAR